MPKRKPSTLNQDTDDALKALSDKVKTAQSAHNPDIDEDAAGWALGIRYASEFSAAVIVGGLLGYGVDHFAGSTPWALFVGMILGFTAGTRNIIRLAKNMSVEDGES